MPDQEGVVLVLIAIFVLITYLRRLLSRCNTSEFDLCLSVSMHEYSVYRHTIDTIDTIDSIDTKDTIDSIGNIDRIDTLCLYCLLCI